jgi:hypothetical protein
MVFKNLAYPEQSGKNAFLIFSYPDECQASSAIFALSNGFNAL